MGALKTFLFALSWQRKLWFIAMYVLSGLLRGAVLLLPMRWLTPILGRKVTHPSMIGEATARQQQQAWQIGRTTELVSRYTLWDTKCLIQSFLCALWCRFYRIHCVTYLGVHKDNNGQMKAHSWTRVGQFIVTGREGHKQFTVVSTFNYSPNHPH